MKLSICAETVYPDMDIGDKIEAIGRHGIKAFELWTLDHDRPSLEKAIQYEGYQLLLFCGNRSQSLIDVNDRDGFVTEFRESIRDAKSLKCPYLAVLTDRVDAKGIPIPPDRPMSETEKFASVCEGYSQAIRLAEEADINLLIEPLNTMVDHPGYFLRHAAQAFDLIRALGSPRLKVLYDISHLQIMDGNIINNIESNLDMIAHIHVADVPGRHEPGTGEINYKNIARMLQANNFDGYVGLEAFPSGDSDDAIKVFTEVFG